MNLKKIALWLGAANLAVIWLFPPFQFYYAITGALLLFGAGLLFPRSTFVIARRWV